MSYAKESILEENSRSPACSRDDTWGGYGTITVRASEAVSADARQEQEETEEADDASAREQEETE